MSLPIRLLIISLSILCLFNSWLLWAYPEPIIDSSPVVHIVKTQNYYMYDGIARVTCYGPTGYRTASQKVPQYGMIASSDRTIPLGTKVYIDGYGEMTVEDRTAKWVHIKKGFTFDIFLPEGCTKYFGSWYLKYKIIKQ